MNLTAVKVLNKIKTYEGLYGMKLSCPFLAFFKQSQICSTLFERNCTAAFGFVGQTKLGHMNPNGFVPFLVGRMVESNILDRKSVHQ